jgi:nitrogen fixation-related uncharacterized protein
MTAEVATAILIPVALLFGGLALWLLYNETKGK